MKSIIDFFDKLEDKVRSHLSHYPIFYSIFGGTGVVLFWRGVWHLADYYENNSLWGSVIFSPAGSIILGMCILLLTGLFVSIFIGDSIIMSGLKKEKKINERTEDEILDEKKELEHIHQDIEEIKEKLN